jgi:flagellar FliL protein
MSKDDKDATAEAPKKKSKKMLMIIILAVVLLGGGGAGGWFFFLKGDAAEAAPIKGAVVAIEETMTINLADAHYLKLGFALQMTEEAGEAEVDLAEARDLAIDNYTGKELAELETEKGRLKAKEELLEKIEKAYNVDDKHLVMGIYFTSFVTQ